MENIDLLSVEEIHELRRGLNREYASLFNTENIEISKIFEKILPECVEKDKEKIWYEIACLYATYGISNKKIKDNEENNLSFCENLKKIKCKHIDKKLMSLIQEELNMNSLLMYKITTLLHILNKKRINIDFIKLIEDLQEWNRLDKKIQQKWLITYFS